MKTKTTAVLLAIGALCAGLSGVACAQQDKDVRSDEAARRERAGGYNHDQRPARGQPVPQRHWDDRGPDHDRGRPDHDRGRPGWDRGPGAGPDHDVYRGGRLPNYYRSRQYVVDDWRGHHLRPPPRGYQWVQTGADYALVAIATGIIAEILLNQ